MPITKKSKRVININYFKLKITPKHDTGHTMARVKNNKNEIYINLKIIDKIKNNNLPKGRVKKVEIDHHKPVNKYKF